MSGNLNKCTGVKKSVCRLCFFIIYSPSCIFFWSESAYEHMSGYLSCRKTCVYLNLCVCMWFRMCYSDCWKLALTIWLLEKHLHLWRQSSTCCVSQWCRRLSKSLESRGNYHKHRLIASDVWPWSQLEIHEIRKKWRTKLFVSFNFFSNTWKHTKTPGGFSLIQR